MKQLIVGVGLLLAGSPAFASQLAAGPLASGKINGGPAQNHIACYIFNNGTKAVKLSAKSIAGNDGSNVLTDDRCGSKLGSGVGCVLFAPSVSPSQPYDCAVTASPSTDVRGSIESRSAAGAVLANQALR